MKKPRFLFYALFISFSFYLNSCEVIEGINFFSLEDDVQLGLQLDGEIRSNPSEYPIYTGNYTLKNYITNRIFTHILQSAQVENKKIFNYRLEIINDPNTLNAFAVPGGYIYVYTGLLKYLDSEAALAGVLAHEIAHVEKRHSSQRLTQQYGAAILVSLILGENPSELEQIAANLFMGLAFLANSRSDEDQSDEYSFKYLKDTRYYPGGVKFFFEKMRDEGLVSSNPSKLETFLSTHPNPIERISNTNKRLTESGIEIKNWQNNGEGIFKAEYDANIRSKL